MASGFLSYEDTRGEVDYLSKIANAVKKYLDNREKKETVADVVASKVKVLNETKQVSGRTQSLLTGGSSSGGQTPLQRMLSGSAYQKAAESSAVNPEVMGGALTKSMGFSGRPLRAEGLAGDAIVDIGATNLGVDRGFDDDVFVKRLRGSDSEGSAEVVQAIDRLTFVTMSLVAATKEQTQQQKLIAAAQQQQSEKLARQAKAAAEESALEMGADLSGNTPYQRLLSGATNAMGGSRGGGGPGLGLGGKVIAKNILKSATKRGAAKTGTRLGAALGGKALGGMGAKMGAKLGSKSVGKVAGSAIAKSLGKKIPLVGLGLGAVFAAQRAMAGDFVGAGLELASGAASTVPGIGTAGSVGIDAALAARDMMTPFAEGGIVAEPTNALIGEAGKEGVFPLSGSEGKKTFIKFGEGILEAQRRNENENSKIMAKGLSEYYDKQNGWEKFIEGITDLFKKIFSSLPDWMNPFKGKKDPSPDEGTVTPITSSVGAGATGSSSITSTGAKGVLDLIASVESNGSYDVFNTSRGGTSGKASEKTIGWLAENAQGAIGRYQHMPRFILDRAIRAGYNKNTVFTPEVQDAITIQMLKDQHGLDDFLSGKTTPEAFAAKLAPTWRGLPQGKAAANRLGGTADSTYNDQYSSGNKAHMSWIDSVTNLTNIQSGAEQTPKSNNLSPTADDMNWYNKQMQESQSFLPSAVETGNALSLTSQQVASASLAPQAAPIIQNFYGTGTNQSGGNAPMTVPFGIGSESTGTPIFNEFSIRSIG